MDWSGALANSYSEPSRSWKRLIGVIGTASLDDPDLVRAAMAGDEPAFDALVGPLIPHAYRLAAVLLRDPGEAEDAVQEACLKAWRSLGRLRHDTAVRAWFLTIVANQCHSMRRARWWSVLKLATVDRSDPPLMEGHEDRMDLDREVSLLPDTDRAVLFLFFYLDLPLAEVARILRISPQAAKSRLHRAVTRVRLDMVEVSK
ncbi:MAG TPA: RNA polymerase sigma factor [Candidatus Dormibacteraeota bacterium]